MTNDAGRAAKLAASDKPAAEIIEELYLAIYNRFPTAEEQSAVGSIFAGDRDRRRATEDLMWALMNTPEFIFKD